MAVRIRVRLRILDKEITTTVLVNTGFETDEPQLLVPDRLLSPTALTCPGFTGRLVEP